MKNIAIKENHLYNKAYKRGKCFVGKYTAIYILRDYSAEKLMRANPQKQYLNRVGLAVSKKLGGAVQRNRAKRVIRAAFDTVKNDLRTGNLIVISARFAINGKKSCVVADELRTGFAQLDAFASHISHETAASSKDQP